MVHAVGAKGKSVEFSLRSGALEVAKANVSVASDDARLPVTLAFVPSAAGVARLRVGASISGSSAVASAEIAVDVGTKKFSVLFYDARPSWMSTFVRRAIERDSRFAVTSRVVTSRNISTDVGQPPALFGPSAAPLPFDAIVVGAPEALREAEIAGLRAFSAQRGGSVVLIADSRAPSALQKFIAPGAWSSGVAKKRISVEPSTVVDSGRLAATEFTWPRRLPAGAVTLASSAATPGDSLGGRPVIWRVAEGAGQFVVSGALDAWRFRDDSVSAFDTFWPLAFAHAAAAAPPCRPPELSPPTPGAGAAFPLATP